MARIAPCLWFDGAAEAAARFYVSLLPDSRIDSIVPAAPDAPGGEPGAAMIVAFTLAGQRYLALNGGPGVAFTPAISLSVTCADQAEVDRLWAALSDGGTPQQCGWIADRFGVSWQVVPDVLPRLMRDPDPARVRRVTEAMMQMVKLDVAGLCAAAEGVPPPS